jgi:hypothetical protein
MATVMAGMIRVTQTLAAQKRGTESKQDPLRGSSPHQHLQVQPLGSGFEAFSCFTWLQDQSYCFALTQAPVQTLPIEKYDVYTCDEYAGHPPLWYSFKVGGVKFFTSASNPIAVAPCTGTLIDAILGADEGPTSPTFSESCAFCKNHAWACSQTQNQVCALADQARRAGRLHSGQWTRSLLNGFVFLAVSGGTLAYGTRPLVCLVLSAELRMFARAIEQWRLIGAVVYWLLVLVVLTYSTYFETIAWTSNIFQIADVSSYFYIYAVSGHIVAVVIVVLDQLLTPAGVQDQDVMLNQAMSLAVAFAFALVETYVAYVWSGAQ